MTKIRSLLTEAAPEELTLPKQPVTAAPINGEKMSATNFAPAPITSEASVANMSAPAMPLGQAGPSTVQKEVINKQLMLAITAELKSVISTYEKKFESEDFTVEDAKIYIHNFLESLAFHADKIANLIGEETPAESETASEVQPEILPEKPSPTSLETEADISQPQDLMGGLSEPVESEVSAFTNPTEVI